MIFEQICLLALNNFHENYETAVLIGKPGSSVKVKFLSIRFSSKFSESANNNERRYETTDQKCFA